MLFIREIFLHRFVIDFLTTFRYLATLKPKNMMVHIELINSIIVLNYLGR